MRSFEITFCDFKQGVENRMYKKVNTGYQILITFSVRSRFVTLIVEDLFADRYHLVPAVDSRWRSAGVAFGQQLGEFEFFEALVNCRIGLGYCCARFGIVANIRYVHQVFGNSRLSIHGDVGM